MTVIMDERCTGYSHRGHPERPLRISKSLERLRAQSHLSLIWGEPLPVAEAVLLRAHSPAHVAHVKDPMDDFDSDTPAYPHIFEHACRSAGGALRALATARNGEFAFSLMRPPGHHAMRERAMGFCYFNAIAIACLEAVATGVRRVAVFDFDVHHGNGTEDILQHHPQTAYFSVHQHPCYPGTGLANVGTNCFNFPLPPHTPRERYRETLARALQSIKEWQPEVLGVSAGFDAYAHDPLAHETLEEEDYRWVGNEIRQLKLPVFSILEGGYSHALPDLILAYLEGLAGTRPISH